MIQVTLLVIVELATILLHPFHLSICEFEYDVDQENLKVTSRIFQDDLEVAFKNMNGTTDYFKNVNEPQVKKDLESFFQKNLQVIIDKTPRSPQFVGYEIEDNVVWCYLEIPQLESISEISISYTVLIDTFADQINLAHVRYRGKVKSLKFQQSQLSGTAVFKD